MMGIQINSFFLGECCLKKNQSAPRLSERPSVRGEKCQMILVQMYNIFRLLLGVPDYSIVVSRMEENENM